MLIKIVADIVAKGTITFSFVQINNSTNGIYIECFRTL